MDGVTVKLRDFVVLRSVLKTRPMALISTAAVRALAAIVMSWSMLLSAGTTVRSENAVETIAFIRHGEKPDKGLGQLNCQGLNRALALPPVIAKLFGRPDAIFAPNPSAVKMDDGVPYAYVRPLATVEPTAISFGLPVDASVDFSDLSGLQAALEKRLSLHRGGFILVAWEHKYIETIVQMLEAAHGGDSALVPKWRGDDFDSIFVVTVSAAEDSTKEPSRLSMKVSMGSQQHVRIELSGAAPAISASHHVL